MPEPSLHDFSPFDVKTSSWITRVRENLRQLFTSMRLTPTPANGAPIHLLKLERSGRARSSQCVSLLAHLGAVAAVLFAATIASPPRKADRALGGVPLEPLFYSAARAERLGDEASPGHKAGGGELNPIPPSHGFFAPRSSIQLAPPRLPNNSDHLLTVTATILEEQAPDVVARVNALGLPWMRVDTKSAGRGTEHGIGNGRKGGMGDGSGPDAGDGEGNDFLARGGVLPTCLSCPYPIYTDEARKIKIQGTVTLRVLVGADGKASEIRLVRGVGFGLEERAVETVRGWKFNPACDAGRHTVAAWITIEAVFRLF
jgi:periplasmic protein TonB